MLPFRGVDGDHVGVAHHEQRTLRAGATQASHQVGPLRIEREHASLDAGLLQHALQVVDDEHLVAWRVLGVETEDGEEVPQRLFVW